MEGPVVQRALKGKADDYTDYSRSLRHLSALLGLLGCCPAINVARAPCSSGDSMCRYAEGSSILGPGKTKKHKKRLSHPPLFGSTSSQELAPQAESGLCEVAHPRGLAIGAPTAARSGTECLWRQSDSRRCCPHSREPRCLRCWLRTLVLEHGIIVSDASLEQLRYVATAAL